MNDDGSLGRSRSGGNGWQAFILRTDDRGERWEITVRADSTIVHRREKDESWLDGWPPSLPLLKDSDTPSLSSPLAYRR